MKTEIFILPDIMILREASRILPQMTMDQTSSYARSPETQILRNDATIQAVSKDSGSIVAVNFWDEAEIHITDSCILHSDGVAAVIIRMQSDTLLLSVADPTWERRKQILEIDGYFRQADTIPDKNVSLNISDEKTIISINQLRQLGATKTIALVPLKIQNLSKAEIKAALKNKRDKTKKPAIGEKK